MNIKMDVYSFNLRIMRYAAVASQKMHPIVMDHMKKLALTELRQLQD